ncbi:MAG: hypothetical protein ACRD2S_02580, partial [Terriglobales bacterium]
MSTAYEDGDGFALGHSERQAPGRQIVSPSVEKQVGRFSRQSNRGPEKSNEGPILMKSAACTTLDPTRRSTDAREFEAALRRKIVGQDAAVE